MINYTVVYMQERQHRKCEVSLSLDKDFASSQSVLRLKGNDSFPMVFRNFYSLCLILATLKPLFLTYYVFTCALNIFPEL